MNKTLKRFLIFLIGTPLLIIGLLLSIFLFKDANDFKPTIESQAKKQIGLNLKIEDELSWSLIPIGLEINQLSILDQTHAPFASADKILASIDFWSLFKGTPNVETLLLDGLTLSLTQTHNGENNWSNILPPTTSDKTANTSNTQEDMNQPSNTSVNTPNSLNFLVESFQLINSHIVFKSQPQDVDLDIRDINLQLSDITLGETFPLTLSYTLSEARSQVSLDSTLQAQLFASQDLSRFTLSDLHNNYAIHAPQLSKNTLQLDLNSTLDINTKTETIDISTLQISLNNLAIEGNANITNYATDLALDAGIRVPEFSLKKLLHSIDIPLPTMQHKDALNAFSLSSTLNLNDQQLTISDLALQLDKSTWRGNISHTLSTSTSKVRMTGDHINIDDYLAPPPAQTEATQTTSTNTESTAQSIHHAPQKNKALLPLETLRALDIDIALLQKQISIQHIDTTDVNIAFIAHNGIISQTLDGLLNGGNYSSLSTINIQHDTPQWDSKQTIQDVDLAPIFETLNIEAIKEYGDIAGLLNLDINTQLSGNNIDALIASATSRVNFHIDQGAFEGLSLNALTCKGFALINKEHIDTSTWPQETPFNTLKGNATLNKQIINTQFDLISAGVHADSQGTLNLLHKDIEVLASLKVIGELGDNACRVNKKVKTLGIPVKCQGSFDTPPAELCTLDSSRLGDMAKTLAIKEGKRKINKEVDRALNKHLGDKKAPLKSLLNKFLK